MLYESGDAEIYYPLDHPGGVKVLVSKTYKFAHSSLCRFEKQGRNTCLWLRPQYWDDMWSLIWIRWWGCLRFSPANRLRHYQRWNRMLTQRGPGSYYLERIILALSSILHSPFENRLDSQRLKRFWVHPLLLISIGQRRQRRIARKGLHGIDREWKQAGLFALNKIHKMIEIGSKRCGLMRGLSWEPVPCIICAILICSGITRSCIARNGVWELLGWGARACVSTKSLGGWKQNLRNMVYKQLESNTPKLTMLFQGLG